MKKLASFAFQTAMIACLIILNALPAAAQNIDFKKLESVVNAELAETNTPGAALAVVQGERVVFAKGFGAANVETGEPVTAEMLFRIGSMTKTFTALALLGLVEEGKLKLEEPLGNYVKGLNPKLAQITLHQLLAHTSGLRDEGRPYGAHDETALLETVRGWKEDYLFTEPGRIFSYSNLNYALAGAVIEETSGKPFADAMSERVYKPLGMSRATFRPTVAMTYPLAQGHNARGNAKPVVVRPYTDNVPNWAAGYMFASVNDLARFAVAFLNDGKLDGKQAIAAKNIVKASSGSVDIPGLDAVKYGYGLRVEEIRGVAVVSHGGAIPGFGAQIIMSPRHRVAVIVLANKSGARLDKTVETALEMTLPLKVKPETKPPVFLPLTAPQMQSYAGVYRHSPRQFFEIAVQEGKLFLKDEEDLLALENIGENRFLYKRGNSTAMDDLTFVTGADGKPEYLHINGRAFRKGK
ncbi:MAG TPA: serine hydrolase [Pyrinomonadaceae bacterium]|jgi:CubicO group peptidase (beta-lactamase class C family)